MADTSIQTNHDYTGLARKAGLFTLSRAIAIVAQLLAVVILTRTLPQSEAGVVFFLLTIYGTAQAFGQLGLPDSVFYFFEKMPPQTRRNLVLLIARALFVMSLAGAGVMLMIAWAGSTREGFSEVRSLIWGIMVLLALEMPTLLAPNVLIALNRAKWAAYFQIFSGLTQFAAMTVPLIFFTSPVSAIVWSLALSGALRFMVVVFLFSHIFNEPFHEPLPSGTFRSLLAYAVPLSMAQVFWSLNRQVDKYVVQWFLPAQFAVYSAGAYELPILPTIAYSVAAVMMPHLSGHFLRGERGALLDLWHRSIEKVSVIVLPLMMMFVVVAEEFIGLLFPENYSEAVVPFRIYTLILLQRVASYSNMQKAIGSTGDITRAAVLLWVVNSLLAVPLLWRLGMAGPPLAALIANTFSWWYSLTCIQRHLKIRFLQTFPFKFYLKTLVVTIVAALPVFWLKNIWSAPPAVMFFAFGILYLGIYGVLANLAGVLSWRKH